MWTVAGAKGGVGTTVIAAAVALELARESEVLLVDLAGDHADLLGIADAGPAGVWNWLAAGDDVGADALDRVMVEVTERVRLLPPGSMIGRSVSIERVVRLADALADRDATAVVDLGVMGSDLSSPARQLMETAGRRILVVRPCYLALRRVQQLDVAGHDVVEVREGGRALSTIDIEAIIGKPVFARVDVDPGIARVADAGLLCARMPRRLRRLAGHLVAGAEAIERTGT